MKHVIVSLAITAMIFSSLGPVVLGRLRSLLAVDEGVGEIFRALKETGQLDNTVIVFSSDNGYFYGEHVSALNDVWRTRNRSECRC